MRFIKQSARVEPKVSLVLLDWSVRESFHLLHYLSTQSVPREAFEVIVIEYYDRVSEAVQRFEDQVDSWIVLDMPRSCYYHKHLMYNAGIIAARGEIVMIGDSDAMVRESFIETIVRAFEDDPAIVLHMDQFRNLRRDFYPFNFPPFDEVLGVGCTNNGGGVTTGLLPDTRDPIHRRNYGACMCARRDDLIAIGGSDMHLDFLGHICGPYDMTFRLVNHGRREVWHDKEFMAHTWHPGQAGDDNYLGPHDGRHVSTTALEARDSGRVMPLRENEAVRRLRYGEAQSAAEIFDDLIAADDALEWDMERLRQGRTHAHLSTKKEAGNRRTFRAPRWYGESLAGRRILLWCERGLGDELKLARYYESVAEQGGEVIVQTDPRLMPLFRRALPGAVFEPADTSRDATREDLDFHAPAGGLPDLFPVFDSRDRRTPGYLKPDPDMAARWKLRLDDATQGLKVGICWRGGLTGSKARDVYCPWERWKPVLSVPGVTFVNLQYDDCATELRAAETAQGISVWRPDLDLWDDFDGAAALISALDLVIAGQTRPAELAVALGVPTWIVQAGALRPEESPAGGGAAPGARGTAAAARTVWRRHESEAWDAVMARVACGLQEAAQG